MKNKELRILVEDEVVTLSYFEGRARGGLIRKKQMRVKCSDLPYPDDFIYACAYLIDAFSQIPLKEPYKGKTVCIASPDPDIFKVGKIYEWKDGRTVGEDRLLHPTQCKLYSLDEITNPDLKFVEIVE